MVKNGHVIDMFACDLDQTGLMEMKNIFNSTNGRVYNHCHNFYACQNIYPFDFQKDITCLIKFSIFYIELLFFVFRACNNGR